MNKKMSSLEQKLFKNVQNLRAFKQGLKICGVVSLLLCLMGSCLCIINNAMNTPDVIYSYSTKQCKEVIYADGTKGDCDNLPEKYNFYWGE